MYYKCSSIPFTLISPIKDRNFSLIGGSVNLFSAFNSVCIYSCDISDSITIFHEALPPFEDTRALNRGETRFRYGQRSVPLNFDEGRTWCTDFPRLSNLISDGRRSARADATKPDLELLDRNANVISTSLQFEIRLFWSGNFRFRSGPLRFLLTKED